jgi:hypothetical protein
LSPKAKVTIFVWVYVLGIARQAVTSQSFAQSIQRSSSGAGNVLTCMYDTVETGITDIGRFIFQPLGV